MKKLGGAAALAAVIATAGCSGGGSASAPSPTPLRVVGHLTLATTSLGGGSLEDLVAGKAHCAGAGGYSDITEGAQVTVTDASSKVVALGQLGPGTFISNGPSCIFDFEVSGVPAGQQFYGIEVAHRGVTRYEGNAVTAPSLTLGNGS